MNARNQIEHNRGGGAQKHLTSERGPHSFAEQQCDRHNHGGASAMASTPLVAIVFGAFYLPLRTTEETKSFARPPASQLDSSTGGATDDHDCRGHLSSLFVGAAETRLSRSASRLATAWRTGINLLFFLLLSTLFAPPPRLGCLVCALAVGLRSTLASTQMSKRDRRAKTT